MVTTARRDLNRVQYSGLDFDTHNDDLLARLQVEYAADFNDFALSSLGIVLLDLEAFGLDTLSFYLDRRATDNFLQTARTRASVSRLTRQLGYKMGSAVASSVDLTVSIATAVNFSVTVPAGTQFNGPEGLIFESAKDVTYAALSTTSQSIPCYEGESLSESFVSDGTANQVFQLARVPDEKFVAQGSVQVVVDGATFTESEFLTFDKTDQFEFASQDDPPTVRFGDGTAGNIPKEGASITVSYIATTGRGGLVGTGTITELTSSLVVNATQIDLTITNTSPSVGGDDPESIESAKRFAPLVFKSREVAVTRGDYEALAGSFADPLFGRVAVAQAISSRTGETDLTLQNLVGGIQATVSAASPTISTAVSTGNAHLSVIDATASTSATSVDATLNAVVAKTVALDNANDTNLVTARQSKQKTTDILANHTEISARVADGNSSVTTGKAALASVTSTLNGIATAGSDQLTAATKTALAGFLTTADTEFGDVTSVLTRIQAQSTAASEASTTISSNLTTMITQMGVMLDDLANIGLDRVTSGSRLFTLSSANTSILSASASARSQFTAIGSAQIATVASVSSYLTGVTDHVAGFLSADCKANLITVPILTKDASGFFAAPSNSLIQSLQTYLDLRKEVTQTVSVTSGEKFLVPAVITVRVGVKRNYSLSVVKNTVVAAIDTVLRDRKFGESLYESELDEAIEAVEGWSFWNVKIDGAYDSSTETVSTTKLDSDGNLIVSIGEIITKATTRDAVGTAGVVVNVELETTIR